MTKCFDLLASTTTSRKALKSIESVLSQPPSAWAASPFEAKRSWRITAVLDAPSAFASTEANVLLPLRVQPEMPITSVGASRAKTKKLPYHSRKVGPSALGASRASARHRRTSAAESARAQRGINSLMKPPSRLIAIFVRGATYAMAPAAKMASPRPTEPVLHAEETTTAPRRSRRSRISLAPKRTRHRFSPSHCIAKPAGSPCMPTWTMRGRCVRRASAILSTVSGEASMCDEGCKSHQLLLSNMRNGVELARRRSCRAMYSAHPGLKLSPMVVASSGDREQAKRSTSQRASFGSLLSIGSRGGRSSVPPSAASATASEPLSAS
mmetsp:Transcript_19405/g.59940  ORF Transcript_19405/g.59940 Transcript_19405/m.59940 type:complete len:325 (+) Transcript_19405:264-1238(+)